MSRPLCAAIAAIGIGLPSISSADDRYPMMDHYTQVECVRDTQGKMWRIQCNHATKVCLYAADDELDGSGERRKPLERASAAASTSAGSATCAMHSTFTSSTLFCKR